MSHADKILAVCNEIANERARQDTEEGYSPEHDDTHDAGELAEAAAAFALVSTKQPGADDMAAEVWPLEWAPMKPQENSRRALLKAGALIVAEIERLDRATIGVRC